MAGKRTLKVRALVNLKYNKEVKKMREELTMKLKDAQELIERGIVEPMEDMDLTDQENNENTEDGE